MFSRGAQLALVVGLAGCSNILGIDDPHLGSGSGNRDGGEQDTPISSSGVFAGTVTDGAGPVAGATLQFYRDSPYELLGMVTTGPTGAFRFQDVPSLPVDGYFAITASGRVDQYNHLLEPSSGDSAIALDILTAAQRDDLYASAGLGLDHTAGLAMVYTVNGEGVPVAGAMVTAFPTIPDATICYPKTGAIECGGTASTDATGKVIIFNAPAINNFDVTCPQTGLEAMFPVTADAIVVTAVRPQS